MSDNKHLATQHETSIDWDTLEKVVVNGDLSQLSTADRINYYKTVCESVGLNPATSPFEYIKLSGKLTLYPKRDATDQLRRIHRVSITIVDRQRLEDVYIVTARATTPDGRADESTGVVTIANLKGDNLANALMKAETKAKRRVTLSICGLGMLDESELDTIRGAQTFSVEEAHHPEPVVQERKPSDSRKPVNLNPEPEIVEEPAVAEMASEKQIRYIAAMTPEAGYTDETLKTTWLKTAYGVESKKDLTKDQASEVIHVLQLGAFAERLKAAESERDLNLIAAEIKEAGVKGQERKQLGDIYSKRIEELTSAEGDDELDQAWEASEPEQAEMG